MPDKSTSTRFHERYEIFAKRTSFHGFREVNDSKSWPQRVFWIVIMIFCTAMLTFHVQIQVAQYLHGNIITKITALADEDAYPYPPIWIAFNDWLWLDMKKLEKYEITYEELQIAKSYLVDNVVYDSISMTLAEAKKKFAQRLASLNRTGVVDFFLFFSLKNLNSSQSRPQFKMFDLLGSTMFGVLDIGSVAKQQPYARTLKCVIDLNRTEYVENAWKYFRLAKVDMNRSDLTNIQPPFLLNLESSQEIPLMGGFIYHIGVDSKVYRYIHDCREDQDLDPLYHERICALECEIKANLSYKAFDACLPNNMFYGDLDTTRSYRYGTLRLCQRGIDVNGSIEMIETPTFRTLSPVEKENRDSQVRECKKLCIRKCQMILTSWSVSSAQHLQTENKNIPEDVASIAISVPDKTALIIFEEVRSYAWHDMVSDLGGLLGLWLGASMMSLFQVIHLCCWAETKKK